MQETMCLQAEKEKRLLENLYKTEDLAEKKARVYSRLLTEPSLAQNMEQLADAHLQRKQALQALLTGEMPQKQGGMSETKQGGNEE